MSITTVQQNVNREIQALVQRLTYGQFVRGCSQVALDGQPIGEMHRAGGWYELTVLGEPWAGGTNIPNALKSVAVAYRQITQQRQQAPARVAAPGDTADFDENLGYVDPFGHWSDRHCGGTIL